MSLSHCWFSELLAERDELHPLLDFFEDSNIGIAFLVDFHALKSSLVLLDFLVHNTSVGIIPPVFLIAVEGLLAGVDVLPEAVHELNFVLNLTDFGF